MYKESGIREFRPQLVSRRGELIAWATASMVLIAWFTLRQTSQQVILVVPIVGIVLLLAALSISLGNWMDRNTVIYLEDGGISFSNGLRHVHLKWDQIERVKVIPSNWGKKVEVIGEEGYFGFRTLGEVQAYGKTIGKVGFKRGEQILEHIVDHSNLEQMQDHEDGYYYARD